MRAPAATFALQARSQPLRLVAFPTTQAARLFQGQALAHPPIRAPVFLGNLFYPPSGALRWLALLQSGLAQDGWHLGRFACSQREVSFSAWLGAKGLSAGPRPMKAV